MKIIIIGDLHLSHRFNQNLYKHLKKLFGDADKIIINGDFWDYLKTDFETFVKSEKKKLFPLMKSKETIYVYGNHDPQNKADSRVNLFSNKQVEKYVLKLKDIVLNIEHGHEIVGTSWYRRWYQNIKFLRKAIYKPTNITEKLAAKYYSKNNRQYPKIFNYKYKKCSKNLNKQILVCGHLHCPELSIDKKFINHGHTMHGIAHYVEIYDNEIKLKRSKY